MGNAEAGKGNEPKPLAAGAPLSPARSGGMGEKLKVYKPSQGMITRWTAGGIVLLMGWFGCYSLYEYPSLEGWWGKVLFEIQAIDIQVNAGFLVSMGSAAALAALDFLYVVNHPKSADFLIETEAELRKVSWPAKHEYLNSSFVVILSVVILSLWLVLSDTVIAYLLKAIGY